MSKLFIIQPWYLAFGHPAQSLLNTARTIGANSEISYMISSSATFNSFDAVKSELEKIGEVVEYPVKTDSLREGTIKALLSIRSLLYKDITIERIFFLDSHLILLAALWPFFNKNKIKRLGVLYLAGPERIASNRFIKAIINRFLKRKEVLLFLRTDELVKDWQKVFPKCTIKCLPSLEIPTNYILPIDTPSINQLTNFGIIGQIRTGKSIERIVPLFQNDSSIGNLTVAGAFADKVQRRALAMLYTFEGFQDKFLTEEELLKIAAMQDYILMLYDNWDSRMESAMMFVAARVNKPVVVYDKGWSGRMVKTYGNGVLAISEQIDFLDFLKKLPKPNSNEYKKLIDGVVKFREAYASEKVRDIFLREVFY
jgi:hypothetical protein